MRIIASKQNEFGSKTFVVLTNHSIYMLETIGGIIPRDLRTPGVVFKQAIPDYPGQYISGGSFRYSLRTLEKCSSRARRAMLEHR
jgi:hypothetical protein